jgi:hypothetical protein
MEDSVADNVAGNVAGKEISAPLTVGDTMHGQGPLVQIKVRLDNHRFAVDCAACGENVQFTGEGGYTDIEDARAAVMQHRIDHVNALAEEMMGPIAWTHLDPPQEPETTISRTLFTFVVIHRTDQPVGSLARALYEANEGNAVGSEEMVITSAVLNKDVPRELQQLGNDGTFFDMDLFEAEDLPDEDFVTPKRHPNHPDNQPQEGS